MKFKRGRISNTKDDKRFFSDIGLKIELIKKNKKITNKKIAEKINVTPQAISSMFIRLKKGEGIEITTLRKIALALEIELSEFF